MSNETTPSTPEAEDRTVALLSYLTIVGFIVGLVLHSNKKTRLGAYHLRQGLGLALTFMGLRLVLSFFPFVWLSYAFYSGLNELLWVLYVVLVVLGLIAVNQGREKPLPLVGEQFQKWFAGTIE